MRARSGSRLTLVHQPSGIHPKGSPWRIARAKRDAGFVGHDATQSKDPERRPPLRSSPPARQELEVAPPTPSTTVGLPSGLGRSLVILDSHCVACLSHHLNLQSRNAQELENPLRSAPKGTCTFYMGNYRDIFTSRVRTEIHGLGASRRAQLPLRLVVSIDQSLRRRTPYTPDASVEPITQSRCKPKGLTTFISLTTASAAAVRTTSVVVRSAAVA
jgi:hypothetical protein